MPAANYNIIVDQHADFARTFEIKSAGSVVDLTGYTFEASMREKIQSTTAYDFVVVVQDAAQGLITMRMTDQETAAVPAGSYVYDLVMITDSGDRTRLLQGKADVSGGVTR